MRLLAVGLLVLALAGCSSDDDGPDDDGARSNGEPLSTFAQQTPAEIVAAADDAMAAIQSMRVTGTVDNEDGLDFDARVDKDGNCTATVAAFGGHAEAIEAATGSYVKADDAFWENTALDEEQAAIMSDVADGKWVRSPRRTGVLGTFCDLDAMLKLIGSGEADLAEVGDEAEIDGQTAVGITSDASAGGTTTLWVAVDAPHHMLKVETVGGDEPGVFTVSEIDVPVQIELPPASDVLDIEKLAERR
jgi:hypothetical protein